MQKPDEDKSSGFYFILGTITSATLALLFPYTGTWSSWLYNWQSFLGTLLGAAVTILGAFHVTQMQMSIERQTKENERKALMQASTFTCYINIKNYIRALDFKLADLARSYKDIRSICEKMGENHLDSMPLALNDLIHELPRLPDINFEMAQYMAPKIYSMLASYYRIEHDNHALMKAMSLITKPYTDRLDFFLKRMEDLKVNLVEFNNYLANALEEQGVKDFRSFKSPSLSEREFQNLYGTNWYEEFCKDRRSNFESYNPSPSSEWE